MDTFISVFIDFSVALTSILGIGLITFVIVKTYMKLFEYILIAFKVKRDFLEFMWAKVRKQNSVKRME